MRSKRALAPSPLILLLLGVLRIYANPEKNFPSFFEHCNARERERERERERDLDQQEKMESVN